MNKNLVAYFSASGMTAKLAKTLSNALDADLYEIKPAKAYTPEDLNWQNPHSRSSVEMADKTGRPAVSGKFDDYKNRLSAKASAVCFCESKSVYGISTSNRPGFPFRRNISQNTSLLSAAKYPFACSGYCFSNSFRVSFSCRSVATSCLQV